MIHNIFNSSDVHRCQIGQGKCAELLKLFDLWLEPKYATIQFLCADLPILIFQDGPVHPLVHTLKVVRIIQELVKHIVRHRAIQGDVRNLEYLLRLVDVDDAGGLRAAVDRVADHDLFGHLIEDVLGELLTVRDEIVEEAAAESAEYGVV